ncbi:MAG: sigma-70 family RNA polymerase sigma factor [Muribaculaceae bacterium]|nr:sigma-70 family RNA polymerase sigma factor [Muribaculaceae bacterium]
MDTSREERFATVVRDYGSMISGICFSFSSDSQDAADLRQDILLNIWKGLATYRLDSSLSTWLYRVALNTCVSTVRKRKTHVATIALDAVGEYGAEAEVEDQERVEWLYDRIASLPSLDKAIVTMWLDERPYEEIAQVVGISRNNVAVRLNRIKQRMAVGIR